MNDPSRSEFIAEFQRLSADQPNLTEAFFANPRFFPGNVLNQASPAAFGNFLKYDEALRVMEENDPAKYRTIHKGTPFYFLGWLAFDMRDFERGIFYMDAAISEDIRNAPAKWEALPAAKFLFLQKDDPNQTAQRITKILHKSIESTIDEFTREFQVTLDVDTLVESYVRPMALDHTHRSIISSLYSFVMEFSDRKDLLKLRSARGGSSEPFLVHLLKGCLVLESVLKEIYSGMAGVELGRLLKDKSISNDLGFRSQLIDDNGSIRRTLQDIVRHLIPKLAPPEKPHNRALTVAHALRNVTAHSLLWPDVFEKNYERLFKSILFSIYYVIARKC